MEYCCRENFNGVEVDIYKDDNGKWHLSCAEYIEGGSIFPVKFCPICGKELR